MDNVELKEAMISEALMIIRSVDWTEREVDKKLLDLEAAVDNHKDAEAQRLREEVKHLLARFTRENDNMDTFMAKYRTLIANEKKAMLSDSGTKE